jgi:alanine racemase
VTQRHLSVFLALFWVIGCTSGAVTVRQPSDAPSPSSPETEIKIGLVVGAPSATLGGTTAVTIREPDGSRVATLAAGYADGLPRRLSGVGHVLLRGRRCPILGRVSMDQCQIDVTDAPDVAPGDAATLIGADGDVEQTVLDIAEQIDTTPHEPTCALSRRVPRLYVRS